MGEEIQDEHFSPADFERFGALLHDETQQLRQYFRKRRFLRGPQVAGYELEAWLIDEQGLPAPRNTEFLSAFENDMVSPELARFNVEFNTPPATLEGGALGQIERQFQHIWSAASGVARRNGMRLMMIGILPTTSPQELCVENMSDRVRFRALNDQVLRMRRQVPIQLDIAGPERLCVEQGDVMLEAAATSLQVHLQVEQGRAAEFYNASQVAAAPIVAATCNSPFLFGKHLWSETRIPLFEQAVNTTGGATGPLESKPRVTFGDAYLRKSLLELFDENLSRYAVLLPECGDAPQLHHLRLHNGTIWRWNRPLIGFDDQSRPHLRIEHRVIPAGPSVCDMIANSALYFGLVNGLVEKHSGFESRLAFSHVKDNFYRAARGGLDARAEWWDGGSGTFDQLLLQLILPLARHGLLALNLDAEEIDHYLDIISQRVRLRRTGSDWQRGFVARYGPDMRALTEAYWERQESGKPVSEWS